MSDYPAGTCQMEVLNTCPNGKANHLVRLTPDGPHCLECELAEEVSDDE